MSTSPGRATAALVLALTGLGAGISAADGVEQPAAAPPAAAAGSLSLADALGMAIAANRSLAATRLTLAVSRAGIAVAGQRPNPDLAFEDQREAPHEAASLSLPIEAGGKRGRRLAAARANLEATESDVARSVAELRNQVRRAYFTLDAAQARRQDVEALEEIAKRTRDAAHERFKAGEAARLEQLQADLAFVQASNEAESARAALIAARADLNVLLARDPAAPVEARDDLSGGQVPSVETAVSLALASSTALAQLDKKIAAEAAKIELARAQQIPDPVLSGSVTHDAPGEFVWGWRAGLTLTLPIFTHHHEEVAVEERTLAQLQAERAATAEITAGEVFAAAANATAQQAAVNRYRTTILPQATEVETMAEDSYRSGETGLVALLQAQQANRDLRLKLVQTALDFQNALADLEQAIGAPLP